MYPIRIFRQSKYASTTKTLKNTASKERVIKIPQFHPFHHTQGERKTFFVLKQFICPKSLFHKLILCVTLVKTNLSKIMPHTICKFTQNL